MYFSNRLYTTTYYMYFSDQRYSSLLVHWWAWSLSFWKRGALILTSLLSGLRAHSSFQKIAVCVCVVVEVTAKLQGIHRDHDHCKVAATNSSNCIGFFTGYCYRLFSFTPILAQFLHRRNLLLATGGLEDSSPSLSLYGWKQWSSASKHQQLLCDQILSIV
jgi:hypothetical protein